MHPRVNLSPTAAGSAARPPRMAAVRDAPLQQLAQRLRAWQALAVSGGLLICLLCLGLLAHFSDTATLNADRRAQEMESGFIARAIDGRLEIYQRVLQSMGQGMHTSMLDTPAMMALLLREDAGYAGIFDSLLVASSSGEVVSYTPFGGKADVDSGVREALQRTLSDGKPQVQALAQDAAAHQLGVLLTVPLRQADGAVRGALAAMVRLPHGSLLPQHAGASAAQRFMLVDQDGNLLAHSQPAHTLGLVQIELGARVAQWDALASTSTPNADTQRWGQWLVTRVGLPLPRWQVVGVRDVSAQLLWVGQLQPGQWAALLALALGLALALWWLLWLQSRAIWVHWPGAAAVASGDAPQATPPTPRDGAAPVPLAARPENAAQALMPSQGSEHVHTDVPPPEDAAALAASAAALVPHRVMEQLLNAMPVAALWVQGNVVRHASLRAAQLLEMDWRDLVGISVHALLRSQPDAAPQRWQAQDGLAGFGYYRSQYAWHRPGQAPLQLQLEGVQLQPAALGSVWLLQPVAPFSLAALAHGGLPYDTLTGLHQRETLKTQLAHWCQQPTTARCSGALLWLEIDYFSVLHTSAGQQAGDEVLRQVAWLLQKEQGPEGISARMGADSFALWLRAAHDEAAAEVLAWRLCKVVEQWRPRFAGQRYALGLSVGWLWMPAEDTASDAAALLQAAEAAARAAKDNGQGCAVRAQLPAAPPAAPGAGAAHG